MIESQEKSMFELRKKLTGQRSTGSLGCARFHDVPIIEIRDGPAPTKLDSVSHLQQLQIWKKSPRIDLLSTGNFQTHLDTLDFLRF